MSLFLYNTLSQKKELFRPHKPPVVKMYVCGPTVYGLLHVGNFRGAVVYNSLRLWLEKLGYQVSFHYNLTDVDDKIIQKAKEEKTSPSDLSEKYIEEFFKDFEVLKLSPHTANPKATEFISEMIQMIQKLIQTGQAYESSGHVFYSVRSLKKYGSLSRKKLDELEEGSRKMVMKEKKDPLDFSLWKPAKEGEPSWSSPWGKGRPGWHTECVVMIQKNLGQQIDIHGGGIDLVFPHHENEKAQAEVLGKAPFVKYWVHHNMFESGGQKISKSLGTLQTLRAFLNEYHGEAFKYLVLSSHYRSVSEVSQKTICLAFSALSRVYQALVLAKKIARNKEAQKIESKTSLKKDFLEKLNTSRADLDYSLNDDFNTAKALGVLFSLLRTFNALMKKPLNRDSVEISSLFLELFKEYGQVFSLFQEEPLSFLDSIDDIFLKKSPLTRKEIDKNIEKRASAKKERNFKRADEIRDKLKNEGIDIQDHPDKTEWRMNPSFFA